MIGNGLRHVLRIVLGSEAMVMRTRPTRRATRHAQPLATMNRLQRTSLLTAGTLALLGLAACGGESGSATASDPTLGLPKMDRPADWSLL